MNCRFLFGYVAMSKFGAREAKSLLLRLLQQMEAGERIVITKHHRPVAELVPFRKHDPDKVRTAIDFLKEFQTTHSLDGLSVRRILEEDRRH